MRWLDDSRADLIYALRTYRRTPGLALILILSLALGIGVNALAFTVVEGILLRPLPIADPDRVVTVQGPDGPGQSYPNYVDLRDRVTTLGSLAAFRIAPMSVESAGAPRRAWGYLASGNYFDTLGVTPALGRFFHAEDDRRPGDAALAVLSYDEWQSHFQGSAAVLGETIRINKVPYVVIGVTPRGFHGTEVFYRPDIWVPMMMEAQIEVGNDWLNRRETFNVWLVGRLKAGMSRQQAEANLNAIAQDLARAYPWPNRGMVLRTAQPGLIGSILRGPVEAFSIGVLTLSSLVLVLACLNLASLLLARGTDRQREMAIRASIGAGRGRLFRQLVTEALLLSSAGGICGFAAAAVVARALSAWQAPVTLPVQFDVAADRAVIAFCFGVALVAAMIFGIAPARVAASADPNVALKGGAAGARGAARWPMRDLLIAAQVAVSFVLVTACFVSLRGLQHALNVPLGLEPHAVAVASLDLDLAAYDRDKGAAFQRRLVDEAAHLPGVSSAAYSNSVPLSIDQSHNSVYPEHAEGGDASRPRTLGTVVYEVSPGFFRTLGIRLLAGRDFDARDTPTSPRVAVVNHAFVRKLLQTETPIGAKFRYGPRGALTEVIGVVEDGKYQTLTEAASPAAFNAASQWYNGTTVVSARAERPPAEVAAELRDLVARLDPSLPLYDVGTLDQMLGGALFPNRAAALALGVFGLLALALAATGLYSLVSYAVARRSREIAIRLAVGADAPAVLRAVLGRTAALLGGGAVAGAVLAVLATRVLSGVVYGVSARAPGTIGLVALTMIALGLVSCWPPARRALRVDPVTILRAD